MHCNTCNSNFLFDCTCNVHVYVMDTFTFMIVYYISLILMFSDIRKEMTELANESKVNLGQVHA
jgi:hypothetical protein